MRGEKTLGLFFKGLCMGSADIIPGISGGTVALILGIYEELIHSIKTVDLRVIPYAFFAIFRKDYREKLKKILLSIRFDFLVPLLLGIITAFLLLAWIIKEKLLPYYTSEIYSFFTGLILASAIVILLRVKRFKPVYLIHLLAGVSSAYLFLSSTGIYLNHSLPVIFLSGVVSICAMILPGISGAFIMVFLGQYEYMITALRNLYLPPLVTYVVGAFIGIVSFSHILSVLLKKYRGAVLFFLVGLMIGGLKVPVSKVESINLFTISCFMVGLLLVIFVEAFAVRRNGDGSRADKASK